MFPKKVPHQNRHPLHTPSLQNVLPHEDNRWTSPLEKNRHLRPTTLSSPLHRPSTSNPRLPISRQRGRACVCVRARVRVINHRRWKREGRAKMAVDTRRIAETAEARCIPDWPIRPWPSQGSSASSASFLLQEASPSCGELSKPRSFPSHPFPSLHRAYAQLRRAIARIEQPSSLVFLPALPRVSCRGGW